MESFIKHSPAPWSADPEGEISVSIEDAAGNVICEVHGALNDPLCAGNARLITAAPQLLVALQNCVDQIEQCEKMFRDDEDFIAALRNARAALGIAP